MASIVVPGLDLAPSVPSRIVTVDVIDMTEGAPAAGAKIDFILPQDLHATSDGKVLKAGTTTLTLDAQGRVLLPRPLRQALGLGPGARLVALVEDGRLVLTPWERLEEELWAELADVQESLAEELLRERRLEAEKDA